MNHMLFNVSAEAFRKSLEKESKIDHGEEVPDLSLESSKKPSLFSFLRLMVNEKVDKPLIIRQAASPKLKNKAI